MKYIKTKDNVYLKIRDTEYENKHIVVGKTPIDFGTYILKKDVIKQADTIEELCDAYVFVSKSGETHYIYGFDYDMGVKTSGSRIENDEIFRNHLLENGTIYGAIWTSKGLIYVAKMNENGEFELI